MDDLPASVPPQLGSIIPVARLGMLGVAVIVLLELATTRESGTVLSPQALYAARMAAVASPLLAAGATIAILSRRYALTWRPLLALRVLLDALGAIVFLNALWGIAQIAGVGFEFAATVTAMIVLCGSALGRAQKKKS